MFSLFVNFPYPAKQLCLVSATSTVAVADVIARKKRKKQQYSCECVFFLFVSRILEIYCRLTCHMSCGKSRIKSWPKGLLWFQEPKSLHNWASSWFTRARGKCGFWGAIYDDRNRECKCKGGALDIRCMIPHHYISTFNPRKLLKKDPEAQLWHAKCQCIPVNEYDKGLQEIDSRKSKPVPDSASMLNVVAVHFCSELIRKAEERFGLWSWERMEDYVRGELNATLCQKELSDSFKEGLLGLTSSTQRALDHVCGEECEEIVDGISKKSYDIALKGTWREGSYGDICSILVVKKVESHLLGCCGDSCGWNNQTWASDRSFWTTLFVWFLCLPVSHYCAHQHVICFPPLSEAPHGPSCHQRISKCGRRNVVQRRPFSAAQNANSCAKACFPQSPRASTPNETWKQWTRALPLMLVKMKN